MKSKNIFFLIEHQTKIDYSMSYRILQYKNEIMKSAIDKKQIGNEKYKVPIVIGIVLYTGKVKWNAKTNLEEIQEKIETNINIRLDKYEIVDVNEFSEEELLKEENFLSKAMLIEKVDNTNTLSVYMEKIVREINEKENIYAEDQRELLMLIINLILSQKLKEEEKEKLTKKLKGDRKNMLAVLEMIEEENKMIFAKGKKEGKKEGKEETAKKMLEKNIPIEIIKEVTGLTESEILKR